MPKSVQNIQHMDGGGRFMDPETVDHVKRLPKGSHACETQLRSTTGCTCPTLGDALL